MSTIGVGVRVWIGFVPDEQCSLDAAGARCRTGTIVDGPIPGNRICGVGGAVPAASTFWEVKADGWRPNVCAIESILFPIDDDDRQREQAQATRDAARAWLRDRVVSVAAVRRVQENVRGR